MSANRTAVEVADEIIRLSLRDEQPVTPMQVQKLTYFCHAWMLGLGYAPLFQDAVESWQFGPVIRSVYHSLKHFGSRPVQRRLRNQNATFDEAERGVIESVWRQYRHIDGFTLSSLTHAEGTPWQQVYDKDKRSQIIHNHLIRDYYAAIFAQYVAHAKT